MVEIRANIGGRLQPITSGQLDALRDIRSNGKPETVTDLTERTPNRSAKLSLVRLGLATHTVLRTWRDDPECGPGQEERFDLTNDGQKVLSDFAGHKTDRDMKARK